jgi:hypothetical protein
MMKEYTKSINLPPCKLNKDDLIELVKIVNSDIPTSNRNNNFEIYANLPDITISENNIEIFLKHKELPPTIDKLSIRVFIHNSESLIDKHIDLTFYSNSISLRVNGADQTWVLGKYIQILNFLKRKRPWFWWLNKSAPILMSFILPFFIYIFIDLIKTNQIFYAISTAIFMLTIIITINLILNNKLLPYVKIIIKPNKTPLNKENILAIVTVLSFIVSIIGLFIK